MSDPIIIPAVSDIAEMVQAVDAYIHGAAAASLPANALAAARRYYPSPVDKIVRSAEALYSCADKLDAAGLTLVAQLANFAMIGQWHALGQTARGPGVVLAMRRRLGDATVTQAADQDPPVEPQFAASLAG